MTFQDKRDRKHYQLWKSRSGPGTTVHFFCYYTDLLCQMFFKPILSRCIFLQLNYCQNTLVKNERKCPKSKFILKARYCITYNLYSNTKFLLLIIIHERLNIDYHQPSCTIFGCNFSSIHNQESSFLTILLVLF